MRRALIRNDEPIAGYLSLVCHKPVLPDGRLAVLGAGLYLAVLAGGLALLVALGGVLCAKALLLRQPQGLGA